MRIGLFEAGLPNCDHDAGSTAIVELCALAQSMGHVAEYFYTGHNTWGRSDDLAALHIPCHAVSGDKQHLLQHHRLDAALISRPGPAAEWLHACTSVQLPIIYFGHDIHHMRLARGNAFLTGQMSARNIKAMEVLEHHIWKSAAAVIYPSREECETVENYCKKNHALEMPIYDLEAASMHFRQTPESAKQSGTHLLFVGGAHHLPNHDAMLWFARDILPHLPTGFSLSIAGDWPEKIRAEIDALWHASAQENQTVIFTGRLEQTRLYQLYQGADLVLAPLRFGAGVKRKVAEALAFECPVLGTHIAFEGIDLPPSLAALRAETVDDDYARNLLALLTHTGLQIPLAEFSRTLTRKYSQATRKQILEKAFALL